MIENKTPAQKLSSAISEVLITVHFFRRYVIRWQESYDADQSPTSYAELVVSQHRLRAAEKQLAYLRAHQAKQTEIAAERAMRRNIRIVAAEWHKRDKERNTAFFALIKVHEDMRFSDERIPTVEDLNAAQDRHAKATAAFDAIDLFKPEI